MTKTSPTFSQNDRRIQWLAVLLATVTLLYLVKNLIIALLLALIFSAVCQPFYKWILKYTGNRAAAASLLTILVLCLLVFIPSLILIQLLAIDTLEFIARVRPIIEQDLLLVERSDFKLPDWMPFSDHLKVALPDIRNSAVTVLSRVGTLVLTVTTNATLNTVKFVLELMVMLYAMFFFLRLDQGGLPLMMRYSGLSETTQQNVATRIAAVGSSTIRGTLVIGLVQGVLIGIGLYLTGFSHVLYWSALAAIVSVLPAIGVVLVWLPAVVYLTASGLITFAIGLALWGFVVSFADNILRPILVGRETKIPDLMILVTTIGGLATLGASAIILGPIIAGVFLTLWNDFRSAPEA